MSASVMNEISAKMKRKKKITMTIQTDKNADSTFMNVIVKYQKNHLHS
jgi:hypothetical protein